jgi:integrase
MAIKIPRLGKTRHGTFYVRVYFFAQNGQRKLQQFSLNTKNPEEARALALKFNFQIETSRVMKREKTTIEKINELITSPLKHTAADGESIDFDPSNPAESAWAKQWKKDKDIELIALRSKEQNEQSATLQNLLKQQQEKLEDEERKKSIAFERAYDRHLEAQDPYRYTSKVIQKSMIFSEATELYLLEKKTDNAASTIIEKRRTYKDFVNIYGDLVINMINKSEISAWKTSDLRRELGANRINKRLGQLNDFFRWAIDNGHYTASDKSPCDNLFISGKSKLAKQTERKEPFSDDDIKKLFGVVVVVVDIDKKQVEKKVSYEQRMFAPDHYWIPLVCLFSGARREEIGDLLTANVQTVDGVPCFQIEKGKTAAARRVVPIHSQLIELGFLEYASARKAAGDIQLFPHRAKGAGGRSKEAGRMFAKREREDCQITSTRKTIHSLRHSFITRLAQIKADPNHSFQITGHADENSKTVHAAVYTHGMGLRALAETVELLKYPMTFKRLADPTFNAYFNTAGGRGEDEKKAARAVRQAQHLAAKATREERNRDHRKK